MKRAILSIVLMGAILTYSGVSLFVAVFAIYPFAAQLFREADIPKRLIPATIAFSAFTFSMDSLLDRLKSKMLFQLLFKTDIYAAPTLELSERCLSLYVACCIWNGVGRRLLLRERGTLEKAVLLLNLLQLVYNQCKHQLLPAM